MTYQPNGPRAAVIGATIGGGGGFEFGGIPVPDQVLEDFATVGGGIANTASGDKATVGGGIVSTASGEHSTVPGGRLNKAAQAYTFAAGYKARAKHAGTFVWNDPLITTGNDSLVSTGVNQFLIRAAGGVGIGTNNPAAQLQYGKQRGRLAIPT